MLLSTWPKSSAIYKGAAVKEAIHPLWATGKMQAADKQMHVLYPLVSEKSCKPDSLVNPIL
jgi:hypothetical protein